MLIFSKAILTREVGKLTADVHFSLNFSKINPLVLYSPFFSIVSNRSPTPNFLPDSLLCLRLQLQQLLTGNLQAILARKASKVTANLHLFSAAPNSVPQPYNKLKSRPPAAHPLSLPVPITSG